MSEPQSTAPHKSSDVSVWLERHGDYLFKYAVFRLLDTSAAEDAVQETFLAAQKLTKNSRAAALSVRGSGSFSTDDAGNAA